MHTQNTADQISKMRVKDEQEKKGLNKTHAMGLDRGTLWPARLSDAASHSTRLDHELDL